MFKTINEALDWLYAQKKLNKREDLHRISFCCKELKLELNCPVIHIAGTNGKGSTASYIKNILKHTGKKIGFFVSPYVVCFNERIEVNDRYISDAEVMHYCNQLKMYALNYTEKYHDVIPFFELTFLMALLFFKDRAIDLAVIECGVGGLLDATNCLKTDLAIITNIGYDHMNTLGNTLEEIASHKLGIVHDGMTCLTTVCEELKPLFKNYAQEHNARMIFVDEEVSEIILDVATRFKYKNVTYQAGLFGRHQAYNAALAIEAVKQIDVCIPKEIIDCGLEETKWPGRMEWISKTPNIILDGAHNIHGVMSLVETLKEIKKEYKIKVIFSALHDKEFGKMIEELDQVVQEYYFTVLDDVRATPPEEFTKYTKKKYRVILDYKECLEVASSEVKEDEVLLVTGSLHFISVLRNYYLSKKN